MQSRSARSKFDQHGDGDYKLMSNGPRTLGQSLEFQHDLVIMVHVDLQMLALIFIMEKILKKKKKLWKSQPISDGR